MSDLREKFEALRSFVLSIPAEKLDMRRYDPHEGRECGCVLHHGSEAGNEFAEQWRAQDELNLESDEVDWLFECDFPRRSYPIPTGQPAKDEFLRRLDVLEEKYCGARSGALDAQQEGAW